MRFKVRIVIRFNFQINHLPLSLPLSSKLSAKQAWHYFQRQPPKRFCKKGVLKIFAKFTGKNLSVSFFSDLRLVTLLKKRLWHGYFLVNLSKFLRTPFLQNTSGRLLLYFIGGRKNIPFKVGKNKIDIIYFYVPIINFSQNLVQGFFGSKKTRWKTRKRHLIRFYYMFDFS